MQIPRTFNPMSADIRHARPRLYVIWPLTHAIVCLFIGFNLLMALYFFLVPTAYRTAIFNIFIPLQVWGAIFLCTALVLAWGLFRNDWQLTRGAMMAGIAVKAWWTYILIASMFSAGSRLLGVVAMWLLILGIQIATVVYFAPRGRAPDDERDHL